MIRSILVIACAATFAGCTNLNTKTQAFLSTLPALNIESVKQSITNEAFSEVIQATGIVSDPTTGQLSIKSIDDTFSCLGVQLSLTMTNVTLQASPAQLRAAADLLEQRTANAAAAASKPSPLK